MTDPILEAAARALANATEWSSFWDGHDARQLARAVITAATPLIRAQALEEAAAVADDHELADGAYIAAAIRTLKEQP